MAAFMQKDPPPTLAYLMKQDVQLTDWHKKMIT